MIDKLTAILVKEGHFEFAVQLLERCSELELIRDASLANFLKLCYKAGRVEVMVNAALHWIRSGMPTTASTQTANCLSQERGHRSNLDPQGGK